MTKKSEMTGLIVAAGQELVCDDCRKVMRHPQEYVSIYEGGEPPRNLCVKCARKEGYLWFTGLIVVKEMVCDGCGRVAGHPERYGYIHYTCEEGKPPLRLCEDCSRARGYLEWKKDERGQVVETFL